MPFYKDFRAIMNTYADSEQSEQAAVLSLAGWEKCAFGIEKSARMWYNQDIDKSQFSEEKQDD